MGAKIYDSTSASWKDVDVPKIYNGSTWVNSEGKVWNESQQAWEQAWSGVNELVLYDQGTEPVAGTITKYLKGNSVCIKWLNYAVDVTNWKTFYVRFISSPLGPGSHELSMFVQANSSSWTSGDLEFHHTSAEGTFSLDISGLSGTYYMGAGWAQGFDPSQYTSSQIFGWMQISRYSNYCAFLWENNIRSAWDKVWITRS